MKIRFSCHRSADRRRGIVLVIVLVVVAVLALAGYTFSELMIRHKEAVLLHGRQIQCQALIDSGVESIKQFLSNDEATQLEAGGIYNNPTQFQGVTVIDDLDASGRGKFTVIAPGMDEFGNPLGVRYGLEDESTKLNLNALVVFEKAMAGSGKEFLMKLPGMTEDVADAILDWMDEDDETRTAGAEIDYYSQLNPPYRPKNGPLETVEDLLLVRGVTPQLLFGADVNRNGIVDQSELVYQAALQGLATSADQSPTAMDRGWVAYFTLYSQERNVSSQMTQRINVNNADLQALSDALLQAGFSQEQANFILAYRQSGPQQNQGQTQSAASGELDLSRPGNTQFAQVLELIGAQTQASFRNTPQPVPITCPFPNDPILMGTYLPLLMDNLSIGESQTIPGRININQASRVVLSGIPGMTEEILEKLFSQRQAALQDTSLAEAHKYETWLLSDGVVTLTEMKAMTPFITGGGHRYRAQIIGYYPAGGGSARAEVVFDASQGAPSVLFWRDISHLGRGYSLDILGMDLDTPL